MKTIYRLSRVFVCGLVLLLFAGAGLPVQALSLTLIGPDTSQTLAEDVEYFTRAWGDPKDMNHASDLYLIDSSCNPDLQRRFTGESVSGGMWTATASGVGNNASVYVLNPGWASSLDTGQDGNARPIDALYYQQITFRLYAGQGGTVANLGFTKQMIALGDVNIPFALYAGWNIYTINLPQRSASWSGNITGLWFDLWDVPAGVQLMLDWVRLTPTQSQTVTWTGSDLSGATMALALGSGSNFDSLRSFTSSHTAESISASALSYDVPASLWPGVYQVRGTVSRSGSSSTATSAGSWTFKAAPLAEIVAPSYTSGPDFATTVVGNPWDMNGVDDVDAAHTQNLAFNASGGVLNLTSTAGPYVCGAAAHLPLALNMGGQHVDSNTFKYLSFRYKVDYAPDQGDGGVARARWQATHLPGWPTGRTDDISFYHNQWQIFKLDLSQVTLEGEMADWKNLAYNSFQLMVHERTGSWASSLDWVRLTLENTAQGSYLVKWNLAGATGLNQGYSDEVTTKICWVTTVGSILETYCTNVPTAPPPPPPPPTGPRFIYLPIVMRNYGAVLNLDDANFAYSIPTTGLTVGQSYYVALKLQDGYSTVWWYSELPVRILN